MPILLIWGIFAVIKNYYSANSSSRQINKTLVQLNRNIEAVNALGNALLNTEIELKSSFALREFDTLVSDANEVLSDIIKRSNSISSTQMEHLWSRTAGGERWLIAKTFIETYNFQPGFTEHLLQKAQKDSLLKGSILEFHTRYQNLHELLDTFDKQKLFYNMIEFGAFGKVYRIITPIAETLYTSNKENSAQNKSTYRPATPELPLTEEPLSFPSFFNEEQRLKAPSNKTQRQQIAEPALSASQQNISPAPIINSFANTQSALHSFKQMEAPYFDNSTPANTQPKRKIISLDELEKEINASPENNYDEYAYPFGTWSDEKKK